MHIDFERLFVTPVVVFLNYIDLDKNHNWCLRATATDIDVNGFMLNVLMRGRRLAGSLIQRIANTPLVTVSVNTWTVVLCRTHRVVDCEISGVN